MPTSKRRARVVPIHAPKAAPLHPFDRLYGTDTGGLIPKSALLTGHEHDQHITAYYAVAPSILNGLIDIWLCTRPPLSIDRYTFLDVGAGKGRALLCASLHPFLQTIGVELNPGLANIARANIRGFEANSNASGPLSSITLVEADALAFPLPSAPVVAFLFHPFEAPILQRFLAHIEDRYKSQPGQCDLLYVNAEHVALLSGNPAFTCVYHGLVPMTAEDHLADLAEIAGQEEYGSTGDEICSIYRFVGRNP